MKKFQTYFLYLTIFITGAVILIIEIAGTRILGPFYGSTIYVWSSLITITLGFLALGYFVGGFIADRKPSYTIFYGIILLAGIFTSIIMKIDQPVLIFADRFGLRSGPLVATLILFSLSLFLLGIVSPFAIRLQAKVLDRMGGTSGNIFAFATVGSLVGALLAGFFLVPTFSLTTIFFGVAIVLVVLSLIGIFLFGKNKIITKILIFIAFFLVSALSFNFGSWHYIEKFNTMQIIHQEPSFYADLKVIEVGGYRCLVMDGATQTCVNLNLNNISAFGYVHEFQYLIENQLADRKDILLLGLGGGSLMPLFSENQRVDAVEIDPKIALLAEKFFDLQLKPNQEVFIADARSFVRHTDKKYDWIIVDIDLGSSAPWHIFTKESFQLWQNCLKPNGLVSLMVNGYGQEWDLTTASIVKTVRSVFPSVLVTARSPEDLAEIIIHLSPEKNYPFPQPGKFTIIYLEGSQGTLLTDARSSLDLLMIPHLEEFREDFKDFGGYQMFFAN